MSFPARFDHFEVELSQVNSRSELHINDGGTYEVLTTLVPIPGTTAGY